MPDLGEMRLDSLNGTLNGTFNGTLNGALNGTLNGAQRHGRPSDALLRTASQLYRMESGTEDSGAPGVPAARDLGYHDLGSRPRALYPQKGFSAALLYRMPVGTMELSALLGFHCPPGFRAHRKPHTCGQGRYLRI